MADRFEHAIDFINGLIRAEPRSYESRSRVGLAPIVALLERLGDPHRSLRCVHIAGSKGKGSTALMLEAVLREAGLRTAVFTSPHLRRWTERYRVDGESIDEDAFCSALERARPHARSLQDNDAELAPSFFDLLTAVAFMIARDAGVDYTILETGLGGRLDATNVASPQVTCITTIELEHTDKLGTRLCEIAREKAGIIKPGVPLVLGELPRSAADTIAERARIVGSPTYALGREIRFETAAPAPQGVHLRVAVRGEELETTLPHPARFMAHNAALAVACAACLEAPPVAALPRAAVRALARVRVPGRFEIVSRSPWTVIDGAHTERSFAALREALGAVPFAELHLVISISGGRDPNVMLSPILDRVRTLVCTSAEPSRSMPAAQLAAAISTRHPELAVQVEPDASLAILATKRRLATDDLLCVTGSMYLAGVARQVLGVA